MFTLYLFGTLWRYGSLVVHGTLSGDGSLVTFGTLRHGVVILISPVLNQLIPTVGAIGHSHILGLINDIEN